VADFCRKAMEWLQLKLEMVTAETQYARTSAIGHLTDIAILANVGFAPPGAVIRALANTVIGGRGVTENNSCRLSVHDDLDIIEEHFCAKRTETLISIAYGNATVTA